MSEITEYYRDLREDQSKKRRDRREFVAQYLQRITENIEEFNEGTQLRLFGKLDIYPTTLKYHDLKAKCRGKFKSIEQMEKYINDFCYKHNLEI